MKNKNLAGKNIRRLRQHAKITQEELALASGVSQGYIGQLENGQRRFTQKSLELIAQALKVSLIEFFREENKATSQPSPISEKTGGKLLQVINKREFLNLLQTLPDHIIEHYLVLIRLEKELWERKRQERQE